MDINQVINTLESEPSLPAPLEDSEINQYLSMPRVLLEKLSLTECGEIAVRLSQYSVYLRRYSNKIKSKINWINSYTRSKICDKVKNYSGRWENQDMAAINDDDTLRRLNDIKIKLEKDFDEVDGLSYTIQNLAENFKNLSFAKRQENG